MRHILLGVMAAGLTFVTAANAAMLVATPDSPTYTPGATVTITLTGTTVGAGPGITAPYDTTEIIDVRIVGGGTEVSTDTALGGTCIPGSGCLQGSPWALGGTQGTNTAAGDYQAFSQIGGTIPVANTFGMNAGPSPPFLTGNSTLTAVFTMTAPATLGEVQIELSAVGAGFFGIVGTQSLGSYTVVPEPTAAALMALGLLGLTAAGRHR